MSGKRMQSTAQFLKANLNTQHLVGLSVTSSDWAVLVEDSGKTYIVELQDKQQKIKGLGVFNPFQVLNEVPVGGRVAIGQKEVVRGPPRLPELTKGMVRRAQTIGSKDAGFLVAKLGLGPSDVVLEAGIGSAGLSLHVQRVLGTTGTHITVEPRAEHSKAALENLRRASATWTSVPTHHHIEGRVEESIEAISALVDGFHAILLDLPDHPSAIEATADLLVPGGRLACYCPVTSQMERSWEACEAAGLTVEWAGELMGREWGRASKGGMRPVNGPFGHTAFLLVAQRL
jgi:tRNA (adenine57-N1/adenine58-N1)-methyltransferase